MEKMSVTGKSLGKNVLICVFSCMHLYCCCGIHPPMQWKSHQRSHLHAGKKTPADYPGHVVEERSMGDGKNQSGGGGEVIRRM